MVSGTASIVMVALLITAAVLAYTVYLVGTYHPADKTATNSTGSRAYSSLKFLIVVSRHGNRRLYTYPNDPYPPNNTAEWPYPMGALTVQGRVQMYNLGVKIRSLYNGFLDQYYTEDEFYASSTPYERVVMSGEAFVAGLFPPLGYEIWDKNILWQPIPVYDDSPDKLPVSDAGTCPRLVLAQNESNTLLSEEFGANFTAINDYLDPYTGETATGGDAFFQVWDTFISEDSEGFALPEWTKPVYPEPMTSLAGQMYLAGSAGQDVQVRLIIGPMIQQMVSQMQSKANGTLSPDRQMFFYSGHDVTLVTLQAAIGIPKSSIISMVKPGSAMIFELHQDSNSSSFYVQVLYIDGGSKELDPVQLNIPDCGESCDLTQLENITYKYRNITDYWAECQLNYTTLI